MFANSDAPEQVATPTRLGLAPVEDPLTRIHAGLSITALRRRQGPTDPTISSMFLQANMNRDQPPTSRLETTPFIESDAFAHPRHTHAHALATGCKR
jgi:hypothetical protein